MDTVQINWRWR